jgi:hypothetical protein
VDKGFRPINALKTSSRITQPIRGRLLVVDLALLGIHLLLSLLFFILIDSALLGTAFSLPLVLMVLAYLYQELARPGQENPTSASPWAKVQRLAKRLLWFLFPVFFSMAVGIGAAHLVDRMHWVETVEEELEEVTILVAAEDMIAGEVITEDSVTSAPHIRSLLRLGAIPENELPTILGMRLKISVDKGVPILRTLLQPDPREMSNDAS